MPSERRPPSPALLALLCAAVALAVFSPVLDGGFLNWDDDVNILANPAFRGLGWTQLKWMFTTFHLAHYQPLTWLSLGLDHSLWGLEPFGYHLTSLLLHAADTALVFAVAFELLGRLGTRLTRSGASLGAVFAALFFGLHPLRLESVAWVTERRDVLSGLFYLLTLLFYLKGARAPAAGWLRRQGWALACFAAALLSKEMTITLPLTLLVLDLHPLRRKLSWPMVVEKAPYFALAAAVATLGLLGEKEGGSLASLGSWGLMPRLCQTAYGLVFYLAKTLWPAGLSPVYEAPAPMQLWSWPYWACAALAAGLTVAAVRARRREPAGLALWAFYCITLAPVAGLVKIGHLQIVAADRYSYLACLGWAAAAGAVWELLLRKGPRWTRAAALVAGLAALGALGALSVLQAAVWKDSIAFWNAVLARDPDSSLAHGGLGQALIEAERWDEAVFHLRTQLARHPGEGKDVVNLQAALSRRQWRQADPARYFNNRGAELAGQERYDEAALAFSRSLQADPKLALTHLNMGLCLLRQGRPTQAALHLRRGAELE